MVATKSMPIDAAAALFSKVAAHKPRTILTDKLPLRSTECTRSTREEYVVRLPHQNIEPNADDPLLEPAPVVKRAPLDESAFRQMIAVERKRTERSKAPFLLMLLEADGEEGAKDVKTLDSVTRALLSSSRDTDLVGWYKDRAILGAIFTGLVVNDRRLILDAFLTKINNTLREELTPVQFSQVRISFHFFPDDWDHEKPGLPSNAALYPDLVSEDNSRRTVLLLKRIIDIAGSVTMLILCAPLFLVIALAIKLSSRGPVFFRQQRVGRYGKTFTFLKFRSMYVGNDPAIHREFVTKLIASNPASGQGSNGGASVYKITNDNRVTRVGKVLRRTSLDELPQFLNVLNGEMSLVGPRPPIPYELAAYQTWHRQRLLGVKPGITGLWQVLSRSTVEFDEMVRLDLRYASTWTPWLDFKILLRTPLVVIKGTGAY
jgi:lipopolysaccharide/colanic/teichoic acid biosynthesis glycosyltransferase